MKKQYLLAALLFVILEIALILFIDRPLSHYLRGVDAHHPQLVNFFRSWTDLGKSKWYLWPSGIAFFVTLGLSYLPSFSAGQRKNLFNEAKLFGFFFLCVSISGLVTDLFKRLIGRARPVLLDRQGYYGFDPVSFSGNDHYSFPSGHTTTAFAVAFALAALFPRARPWLIAFAVALATSRVMVNAHFLSDTFAGATVGMLTVLFFQKLFIRHQWLDFPHIKRLIPRR